MTAGQRAVVAVLVLLCTAVLAVAFVIGAALTARGTCKQPGGEWHTIVTPSPYGWPGPSGGPR